MGGQTTTRVVRLCVDSSALTSTQQEVLAQSAGTARAVWNWALRRVNAHEDAVRAHVHAQAAAAGTDPQALFADADWRQQAYRKAHADLGPTPRSVTLGRAFTTLSRDPTSQFGWWRSERHGVNRFVVSSALRALDAAITRYYRLPAQPSRHPRKDGRPAGWPRPKSKKRSAPAFALYNLAPAGTDPWRVIDGAHRVRLPSLGSVRVHENTRRLRRLIRRGGRPTSAHLTRQADRWYVAVSVAVPVGALPAPVTSRAQQAAGVVGVDLGVTHLAVLSTGQFIPNPSWATAGQRKLARLQRAAARRRGPSSLEGPSHRWKATHQAIARHHQRVAARRRGHLHQLTKTLATRWATVAVEDLNVRGMTAAPLAVPDPDRPGSYLANGAAAKRGLNKAILDVGFGEFRRQLTYKTDWYGARLVAVARYARTSKTCSACGAVKAKLSLAERTYRCDDCGLVIDRDLNAARNIRELASRLAAASPPDGGDGKRRATRPAPTAVAVGFDPQDPAPAGPVEPVTDSSSSYALVT